MKNDEALNFMESLENEDEKLASFVKMYEALSASIELENAYATQGSLAMVQACESKNVYSASHKRKKKNFSFD